MYDTETKMLLRHYLEQGMSKAELARRFQLSRRTIHYWIESGQLDRELKAGAGGYARRVPIEHKLDPIKRIIEARLEVYPKLTVRRLDEEVRAAGYPGSYRSVRDYVRQVRPRERADPVVRFETPPGRQGQVARHSLSDVARQWQGLASLSPCRTRSRSPRSSRNRPE